jgi:hypothetical protein
MRGVRRALIVHGEVTSAELFAWCYARRERRKRVRLSARDGDETFLERRNAYRAIRLAASKLAVRVGRVWPAGNVWRARPREPIGPELGPNKSSASDKPLS